MVDRVGQQFGNYRLQRLLGQGGFAQVYLAEHSYLQTEAAIKILHMRLAHTELKDFLQEARTIAHLAHPHIIQVLDFGLEGSIPYLVMQYAPHGTLRQRHPTGTPVSLPAILRYIQDIASALQHAHDHHLVHRDVKPENILLGKQDELLLSDFGVAVVTHGSGQALHQESGGTVAYMAPEQINGLTSPASDQYALGIVVYEWLCGTRPFQGSLEEIVQQQLYTPPTDLRKQLPTITPVIEQAVLRALAKDPAQRFPCIADFAAALLSESSEALTLSPSTPTSSMPSATDAVSSTPTPPGTLPTLRILPYRRNPFFTGREAVLQTLYSHFHEDKGSPWFRPLAISGLGGIGKTQTAIEFVYRYSADYTAIFWVRADTYETLCSDFIQIAHLLKLDTPDEQNANNSQNQQHLIEAVKQWLEEQSSWLLIFDNVEDLALVNDFIPLTSTGHMLLTTRIQATGSIATGLDLEKLEATEAALLLLRRTGFIQRDALSADSASADFIEAHDIAEAVDGLPLALDQAGAYIEETGCSLFDYFDRYRRQRSTLLDLRGNALVEHPESVATTWLLSFQKVAQINPAAAELLRFCAFLHPDEILEELITTGAPALGPLLAQEALDPPALDAAIATLRKFSLVRRNAQSKSLTMHRLVQAILKDGMDEEAQRLWAERVVRAVSLSFPSGDSVASWPACQHFLPHVYVCLPLIEQGQLAFPEVAHLLDQAGLYLLEQAQYTQARYLLHKALAIREQVQGTEHLDVAETLNYLAGTYLHTGMYVQAEALFTRILAMREHLQGSEHPEVAIELNNLALLYNRQGKYSQAEPLFQRALAIWEQTQGMEHPDVARTLNNLALLYQEQHKFSQAETLYLQALAIWERIRGTAHPDVAISLNNLAKLYHLTGRYTQAEPLFQRVLEIRENTLGPEHPVVAFSLTYLAHLYQQQWKYAEAEMLFKHALHIRKHTLGPEHPDVAQSLCNLGRLYTTLGKFAAAEPLFQEAVTLYEQALGPDHAHVALVLKNYALLLCAMKRKDEAIPLMRRIMAIRHALVQQRAVTV